MKDRLPLSLTLGAGLVTLLAAIIMLSLVWTPADTAAVDIAHALAPPSASHWLGADQLGRDVAAMLLAGARNSIAVAIAAVGIGMLLGIPLGLTGAASRGWLDSIIMRGGDVVFALPALLLAILLSAALGPGALNAALAIGIFNIPVFARVARAGALALWPREFILAARVAGKGRARITLEHILPNLANQLIVQGAIQLSLGVLAEAGLSYVGLGVQPPAPSWGRMLSEAQTYAFLAPWLAIAPGLAIFLSVLGFNLLGDGLRERSERQRETSQ